MTNDQAPMTNKAPSPNDQLGFGIWDLIGHWSLVIPWCLVICWSLAPGHSTFAQEIRLRRTPPPSPAKDTGSASIDGHNLVRGDEITPKQKLAVEKGLIWLANHQGKDGSFGGDGMGKHAGITGLAGL